MERQRRLGALLALCGVLSAFFSGGDITAAVVLVPLGSWMMATRTEVLYRGH